MLAIIAKLVTFRGESRFTTWAYTFVIFEVSSKLGRHFWRKPARSAWTPRTGTGCRPVRLRPGTESEWRELLAAIQRGGRGTSSPPTSGGYSSRSCVDGVPLDALVLELVHHPQRDLQDNVRRPT